jgi:hypothetical protein
MHLIYEIKEQLPDNLITYAIEIDGRGFNHAHLVSDADQHLIYRAVNNIFNKYLLGKDVIQLDINTIANKFSTMEYIVKAPIMSGTLK